MLKHGLECTPMGATTNVNGPILLTIDAVVLEVLSEPLGAPR
jgi:hypothetical protein